jgi:penicillin-binding protein 2
MEVSSNPASLAKRKGRLIGLNIIIGASIFILLMRLFSLQVINSLEYKTRAKVVARRVTTIYSQRGKIFDKNMDIPLVYNIDALAVDLIPGEVPEEKMEDLLIRLSQVLNMDLAAIKAKLPEKYYSLFRPFEIRSDVSNDKIYYITEHVQDFPGVAWHSKPKRSYLTSLSLGSISHVVGYVDNITTEELHTLYNKGYDYNAVIGKSGVEKYYDTQLRGVDGKRYKTVDVTGKQTVQKEDEVVPPEPGKDIVLTIDRHIQKLCEMSLGKRKGSVIVLKPTTGEILALVSYPWFDINLFASPDNAAKYRQTALDPNSPFLNRAIQSVYPPASVFKVITSAAIKEEEVFPVHKTVHCTGSMVYGNRTVKCWKKGGHGDLDLRGALANSCNIYFWTVGLKAGPERILDFSQNFGLGRKTGLDLPGEIAGFLPTMEWKEEEYHMKWLGGDTLNLAIGQGWTLVTPIQIANLIAMVVNDGIIYQPYMVKETRNPETGEVISKPERKILHQSDISKETFKVLKEGMRLVITDGTCKYVISTDAVKSAGKTGTSEVGLEDDFHSWFAAYAPYDATNPDDQVVIVVMVEAVEENWEWWGPKAGNAILHGIFSNQTYEEVTKSTGLWYLKENLEKQKTEQLEDFENFGERQEN